ncbi:hypothetical protein IW261DRAFT_1626799, partial [Armillaria novae-zelandiae]
SLCSESSESSNENALDESASNLGDGDSSQGVQSDEIEKMQRVRNVILYMSSVGLDLLVFLEAVSWGSHACTIDRDIKAARTTLMNSSKLEVILQRWWNPPTRVSKDQTATKVMATFMQQSLSHLLSRQLESLAEFFRSPAGADITEEALTGLDFDQLRAKIQERAPNLWEFMYNLGLSPRSQKRQERRDPVKIVLMIIAMLSYARSHHRNLLQKGFAIYFKFRGLSAKAFDALHALGVTMSHKWTANAVERISDKAMSEWLISYDNLNIPFRVFSQRLDNRGEFGNGCAATVYIRRNATPLSPEANQSLQVTQALIDIYNLAIRDSAAIHEQMTYYVLHFLIQHPSFDQHSYSGKNHVTLQRPARKRVLPSGKENITKQSLLGSVNIAEASYEDHIRLITEWLQQLKLNCTDEKKKLALESLIAWCGDQLTMDRLRGLFRFRVGDSNSFDRMDWMLLIFGWLHLQMAFAQSLFKQNLGTTKGQGLRKAFSLLRRKGLQNTSVRGPFHQHLEEALYHVAEAHILVDWKVVGQVDSLHELRAKSPEELKHLAEKIVRFHGSSDALNTFDEHGQKDECKRQTIMWNRDVLQYITLDDAIKHGDVGIMEAMLPQLLFRFVGGGNSNYTVEVLELLQGLNREWPVEVREFVCENCWVLNFSGQVNSFVPVDQAQEHNIKDIKVTYRSEGPNIKWDYLKKLHPAIPVIRSLADHMEHQFGTLTRGKRHTTPKKESDVLEMMTFLEASGYPTYKSGRRIKSDRDKVVDYMERGTIKLSRGLILAAWNTNRRFVRSTDEEWSDSRSESPDMGETGVQIAMGDDIGGAEGE